MFYIERRMSSVLCRDLSRLSVCLHILIVRKLVVSGRNEGRFERSNPFHELGFSVFVNRDDSDFYVYLYLLLSSDP